MKKRGKRFLGLVLAVVLCVSLINTPTMAADSTLTGQITVTYQQSMAREVLPYVNDLRKDENAWFRQYSEDEPEDTKAEGVPTPDELGLEKVLISGLTDLEYDYDLEAIAMERAMELVVSYSHTRPNGGDFSEMLTEAGVSWTSCAENIAVGQTSAQQVFTSWAEENDYFSDQGHRLNMLGGVEYTSGDPTDPSSYEYYGLNKIGIACVYYEGMYYWAMELAATNHTSQETSACDESKTMTVDIDSEQISSISVENPESCLKGTNETFEIPTVTAVVRTVDTYKRAESAVVTFSGLVWESSDSSVVTVNGDGTLTTLKCGTSTISTTVNGETVSFDVTVHDIEHVVATNPSCTEDGSIEHWHCGTCDSYFSDEACTTEISKDDITIAATGHTPETVAAVDPTCTKSGLTEGSYCSVCGEILTAQEVIAATGHEWGKVVWSDWTETSDGYSITANRTCGTCSETENLAPEITCDTIDASCTEKGSVTYNATVTVDGGVEESADPKVVEIDAPGHNYSVEKDASGEYLYVTFTWPDENNDAEHLDEITCTAAFTCTDCGNTVEQVCSIDVITENSHEASCTEPGDFDVQATVTITNPRDGEELTAAEDETVTGVKLGHSWPDASEFTWNDDHTCTASITCERCGETLTEACDVSSVVTAEAGCETNEKVTYTAVVTFIDEDNQSVGPFTDTKEIEEEGTALGHLFSEDAATFFWEDNGDGTYIRHVLFTCTAEGCGYQSNRAASWITQVTKRATCEEDGETTYIAEASIVSRNGETVSVSETWKEAVPEAIGHDYLYDEAEYHWNETEDGWTCTATVYCMNNYTHEIELTCDITMTTVVEPTCIEQGEAVCTAGFTVDGKTYTCPETKTMPLDVTGHDWVIDQTIVEDSGERYVELVGMKCSLCGEAYEETIVIVRESGEGVEAYVDFNWSDFITADDLAALFEVGAEIDFEVTVADYNEDVSDEDRSMIEELVSTMWEESTIFYLDIDAVMDITHLNGEEEIRELTETLNPVSITITIPDELLDAGGDSYVVLRIHDGEVEVIDSTESDGTLTFLTDKFSTYAIAKGTTEEESGGAGSGSSAGTTTQNNGNGGGSNGASNGANGSGSSNGESGIGSSASGNENSITALTDDETTGSESDALTEETEAEGTESEEEETSEAVILGVSSSWYALVILLCGLCLCAAVGGPVLFKRIRR